MQIEHKEINASLKSILSVSLPLILSALSTNLLYLIDRVIIGYYSIDAMNAVSISLSFLAAISLSFSTIAGASEIYIGQSNGQKQYSKLAIPVWQMIYFSLIGFLVVFPIGYFIEYISLLPDHCKKAGIDYQKLLIYWAPICSIKVALASFFIGQGKTKIITYIVLIGSIANALLDVLFIFGYKDIIPEMGAKGAAIATIFAEFLTIFILAFVFFNKKNILNYGTLKNLKFNKKIFYGCIKLGFPMSIGRIFELLAWYFVFVIISHVSRDLATIHGVCVGIYILFAFICEGINKSSATISSNLIGQRDLEGIKKSYKIFLKLIFILGGIISIPLIFFPESIFYFFDMFHEDISPLYSSMKVIFSLLVLNITLEAFSSALWGILMSGGDTKYPMIANISSLWTFVVIPLSVLYYFELLNSALIIYWLTTLWCVATLILFFRRYKTLKWYNLIEINNNFK